MATLLGNGATLSAVHPGPHRDIVSLAEAAVEMLGGVGDEAAAVVVLREGRRWRVLAASPGDLGIVAGEVVADHERPWMRRLVAALADHPGLAGEVMPLSEVTEEEAAIRTAIVAPVVLPDGILVGAVATMDRRALSARATAASTLVSGVARFFSTAYDTVWGRGEAEAGKGLAEEVADRQHRLITSIAHDFRTPLAVISGMADVLLRHTDDPTRTELAAGTISANAKRLAAMVDGLIEAEVREFSEIAEEPVEIDLGLFLADVASEAEHLISRPGVQLECVASGCLRAPAVTLRRLLLNLLANAIRVTREGVVRLAAAQEGGGLVISVEDTGVGMHADEVWRMTEAYSRGEDSSGFGLGLTIVHRLARVLEAELEVDSTPGEGSTFRLRFPASATEQGSG